MLTTYKVDIWNMEQLNANYEGQNNKTVFFMNLLFLYEVIKYGTKTKINIQQ